jgi:hypothetical protein
MGFRDSADLVKLCDALAQRAKSLGNCTLLRQSVEASWPGTPVDRKAARAILTQIAAIESQVRESETILMGQTGADSLNRLFLTIGTTLHDRTAISENTDKIKTIHANLAANLGERNRSSQSDSQRSPSPLPGEEDLDLLLFTFEIRADLLRAEYERLKKFLLENPTMAQLFTQEMDGFRAEFAATQFAWVIGMGYHPPDPAAIPRLLRASGYQEAAQSYRSTEKAVTSFINGALKPALLSQYRSTPRRI